MPERHAHEDRRGRPREPAPTVYRVEIVTQDADLPAGSIRRARQTTSTATVAGDVLMEYVAAELTDLLAADAILVSISAERL